MCEINIEDSNIITCPKCGNDKLRLFECQIDNASKKNNMVLVNNQGLTVCERINSLEKGCGVKVRLTCDNCNVNTTIVLVDGLNGVHEIVTTKCNKCDGKFSTIWKG